MFVSFSRKDTDYRKGRQLFEPLYKDRVKTLHGDLALIVEAYYGMDEIKALYSGKLLQVVVNQGEKVRKGDVVAFLN